MQYSRLRAKGPLFVALVGATLFAVAVAHHSRELSSIRGIRGPLVALVLDGIPALGLVYAGYWLDRRELSPRHRWTVFLWSVTGSVLLVSVIGASLVVRFAEGRVVEEPLFPLLIGAEVGGIAGVVAGYHHGRARVQARRSETVSNALAFTNDLIRHDLRNDLNLIRGHAELLADADVEADAGTDGGDSSIVVRKADEALTRIETSRVISDTLVGEPDLEAVDLVPVVAELAVRVDETYPVTVTTDLPEKAFVIANVGVRSAVDNLLENAAEHNDADDPRVEVTVEATGSEARTAGFDEDVVRLTVADNGSGISDEQQETIFETGDSGAGGLSVVRTLIDGYGGEIWVEDNAMGGVTFVVVLPGGAGDDDEFGGFGDPDVDVDVEESS